MTVRSLESELADARRRLAEINPELARTDFDLAPADVAAWLDAAAGAAMRREFVLPDDNEPQTLYLWMNDFESNLDRWFVTPFANGPAREARDTFDWRDSLIGDEIGSGLREPDLTLSGMDPVKRWFERDAEASARSAVEDVVLLAAFHLIGRSLALAKEVRFRVAMSRGEEWRVCVWESVTDSGTVHTWRSKAD